VTMNSCLTYKIDPGHNPGFQRNILTYAQHMMETSSEADKMKRLFQFRLAVDVSVDGVNALYWLHFYLLLMSLFSDCMTYMYQTFSRFALYSYFLLYDSSLAVIKSRDRPCRHVLPPVYNQRAVSCRLSVCKRPFPGRKCAVT